MSKTTRTYVIHVIELCTTLYHYFNLRACLIFERRLMWVIRLQRETGQTSGSYVIRE